MFSSAKFIPLFDGFSPEELEVLLGQTGYEIHQVAKNDIIALKGSSCKSLLLLLEGSARCEASAAAGEVIPVERMQAPAIIGPALLYAPDNRFSVHWVAESASVVAAIPKDAWTSVLQEYRELLERFLALVSDVTKPLSDQIIYRTFKTIKGKFSRYLLDQAEAAGSDTFRLKLTQREMAVLFGVTRPALARAIGEMSEEGSIYVERKEIKILFPEKLKQYIG